MEGKRVQACECQGEGWDGRFWSIMQRAASVFSHQHRHVAAEPWYSPKTYPSLGLRAWCPSLARAPMGDMDPTESPLLEHWCECSYECPCPYVHVCMCVIGCIKETGDLILRGRPKATHSLAPPRHHWTPAASEYRRNIAGNIGTSSCLLRLQNSAVYVRLALEGEARRRLSRSP